ncbi:tRNA-dihydrouridine synthase C [Pseudomonas duriflava]|uniref:tRNA-dihydrouridine(16) synthase n=1 Tax=Pseudomonas duriflava TaxID=459528 RepID=A0A562Q8M9_9PSED|nr:tRNA-dihydrouridine synthase [Pseudomonas duriflava]TWI53079.1 tRNA-dihydrouridine synthase C [Pseudomonas duriflava]
MQIALAPMEGLVDEILRELLTQVGGIDWCVTEFIRVTDRLLPASTYQKYAPELAHGSRTLSGTPMRVQFLGSDPVCLAENAAYVCTLGAPVIDLNFGCPAKTVNKSRGGAVLLKEPELLYEIVREVRQAAPASIPVTAKMRLGYECPDRAIECAQALEAGGAAQLVVHARTKLDGYRPPAYWEWIARIADKVSVPVLANGEIWTLEDYWRCREVSGMADVMLGRGLVSRPDLARQIAASVKGEVVTCMVWDELLGLLQLFWLKACQKLAPRYAPGRLKQWLGMLARNYPEAMALFGEVRRETACERIDQLLGVDYRAVEMA